MNEEEIEELDKLKERINCNEDSDCNYCPYSVREECLLDLYNKEKEKNKKLEEEIIKLQMSQLPDTSDEYKRLKKQLQER